MQTFLSILSAPETLIVWTIVVGASLTALLRDLKRRNPQIQGLMRWVWILTVLYSGPLGLWIYHGTGRRQIPTDSIWRRSWRSVAHCYSGCGGGEVAGVFIFGGLLAWGNTWIAAGSFIMAYVTGFALTVGPLVQGGERMGQAIKDALISETASITVMEVTAISLDLWLAGNATMADPLFWNSLALSLTAGLFAAYPVNVILIHYGVKEGMHDPRHHHEPSPEHDHVAVAADTGRHLDIDAIIKDVQAHYSHPQQVVSDSHLNRREKLRILDAWEHDARELAVAAEENMTGGEPSRLEDVVKARLDVDDAETAESGATKFGGS